MNPGYERLLQDYTDYHLALVVVGGIFTASLLAFAGFSWMRWRRGAGAVERRTYLVFALASSMVGLLLAIVVAANLSSVLDPQRGLADTIGTPVDLRSAASPALTKSLTAWMSSGSADVPAAIQKAVDARLAWQEPKAVFSVIMLVLFVGLSVVLWRGVLARPRPGVGRVLAGTGSLLVCFVLMLMVMGNVQASYAPITMTLVFG